MARVFKRAGTYWIDFNDATGRRRRINTKVTDKRVATEVLNDKLTKVVKREHLGVIDDTDTTFANFADVWMKRVAPTLRPRTKTHWDAILALHLKPSFKCALRAVTLAQVDAYAARRLEDGAAPATVNNTLTVLRHVMRRAVEWEYLGKNPLEKLKLLREPSGRTRYLRPEEIETLMASFPRSSDTSTLVKHYLKPLVLLAMNTGARRSELLSLERKDLDWENGIATLHDTKNGEKRHLFLNAVSLEALRSLPPRVDTPKLFPFEERSVSVAFGRVVRRSGLEDLRLHDLRHSFASYQAMAGLSPRALQELLGHKDARMTMRYSHLSAEFLQQAVNRVEIGGTRKSAQ